MSVLLGIALGFVTQRAAGFGTAVREAFAVSTGPWAVVAALIGRRAPDLRTAVVTATVCLWSATLAFYASGGPVGGSGTPGFWLVAIVAVGPALGLLGGLSTVPGSVGAFAAGVIAGWLTGEAVRTALVYASTSRWLGVAVCVGAAIGWVLAARGPRRVLAATLLPMAAAPIVFIAAAEVLSDAAFR
jgi:hypothetical protein